MRRIAEVGLRFLYTLHKCRLIWRGRLHLERPSQCSLISIRCYDLTNSFPFIIDVYRNKVIVSILPPSQRTYSSILLTARASMFPIKCLRDANDVNYIHYKPTFDLNTDLSLKAADILTILPNSSRRSSRKSMYIMYGEVKVFYVWT